MGSYANVLTPRHTHKLWTNNTLMLGREKGVSCSPALRAAAATASPKKPEPPKAQTVRESELLEMAAALRAEAAELESASQAANAAANLKIQFALYQEATQGLGHQGQGRVEGEFRLNLRINVTSQEADEVSSPRQDVVGKRSRNGGG